ncbi:MAG: SoxR reducing system RseC family protein [Bacteroidota bacterium]
MQPSKSIEHTGVIKDIEKNVIKISIVPISACSACYAKGVCSVSDIDDKIIEITRFNQNYSIGEKVNVVYEQSLGLKAVFLGYVLPFLVVFITLIISTWITDNEAISGVLALAMLLPYYLTLLFFKNHLKKTFSFRIKKLH